MPDMLIPMLVTMAISGLRIIRYHKWGTSLMTLCNTPRSVPKAGRSNTLFPNKYQYVQLDISISMTCGT
ncbi:hypothetical protein LguiA_017433 [Lonicera macranthoides]